MTEQEIKDIAKIAAREAVKETLLALGADVDDPLEQQADFRHLRSWRLSVETMKRQSLITSVIVVVGGILGAVWMLLKGGPGPGS